MAVPVTDRAQAGRLLAPLVARRQLPDPIVVGLGAGGLTVAAEVARALSAPLDVMFVRELDLGDPLHPPTYMGAVDDRGSLVVHPEVTSRLAADPDALEAAVARGRVELDSDAGLAALRQERPARSLAGRAVVLVDDGTSPKSVLHAAVELARAGEAQQVIIALPCSPAETVAELERSTDGAVVAEVPAWLDWFRLHGRLYEDDRVLSGTDISRVLQDADRV